MTRSPAPAVPPDTRSTLLLRVEARTQECADVASLVLVDPHGRELPPWSPGAHVDVTVTSGTVRQYSLCGDPAEPTRWRIAILREADGRGGSLRLHDEVGPGSLLEVGRPRNNFGLVTAPSYLLVAGGIGITPMLAMARHLNATSADWRLLYAGRTRSRMALTSEAVALGPVTLHRDDEMGPLPLDAVLGSAEPGTAVYCCGPEGLLTAVEDLCPSACSLHVERFHPRDTGVDPAAAPFEVVVRSTGTTVQVAAGQSILDALGKAGMNVPSSCREGTCTSCETGVTEGDVDHRDSVLSDHEREENTTMMICVSRSRSPRLVLDL